MINNRINKTIENCSLTLKEFQEDSIELHLKNQSLMIDSIERM